MLQVMRNDTLVSLIELGSFMMYIFNFLAHLIQCIISEQHTDWDIWPALNQIEDIVAFYLMTY